jgi:hypothetical protein
MTSWDVIVVGGGPAGLMAACHSAQGGRRTLLLEKRPGPGNKILLSGGTRCNLTHAADRRSIVEAFGSQGPFLHSALAALGPEQVIDLFEAEGVPTKVEPGGKVFPRSDRAADVLAALLGRLRRTDCTLALDEPLEELRREGDEFLLITTRRSLSARKVVLATGGQSYPASGSTGDGYRWAAELGHTIVPPHPALVPITTHAAEVLALQGITIPDMRASVLDPGGGEKKGIDALPPTDLPVSANAGLEPGTLSARPKCLAQQRGALLFAHFGLTGPAVLDVSRAVSGHAEPRSLTLECDFLPETTLPALEAALQRECRAAGKRLVAAVLGEHLPQRLADLIARQAAICPQRCGAELSKQECRNLARAVKQFDIPIAGTMGFRKAEVTAGGVSLDEVDSRTMQSRLATGLFFAGELLDLDGPIGGYNFQAAFSTGWLAGEYSLHDRK